MPFSLLTYHDIEYEKTHDIEDLLMLASEVDKSFIELIDEGKKLTPYAVEIRYITYEDPTLEDANEAIGIAEKIKN